MGKEIASLYATVGIKDDQFKKGMTNAKGLLNQLNNSKLGQVTQQMTGFSLSSIGSAAAVTAVIKEVSKAINETVDYNSQIKDTARLLGLTTEETSRLVQASDDLFISEDTLKTAFQAASRQGIDVSITGIKSLSEQYLALNPGVERAQFLMQKFGRSGADMGKLMEVGAAGIDKAMGAVEDSLIVTQKSIEQSDKYKQNLDKLSDSWTGLKIAVGNGVIPVLNAFISTETDADKIARENIKTQLDAIRQAKARGVATQELLDLETKLLNLENTNKANDAWTASLNAQADAYFRLHPEAKQAADDIQSIDDAIKNATSITDLQTNFMDAKDASAQFDLGLKMVRTGLEDFGVAGEETFRAILLGIGDISPAAVKAYIEMQTVVENIHKMMDAGFSTQVIVDYVINVQGGGGTGIPVVGGASGEFYGGSGGSGESGGSSSGGIPNTMNGGGDWVPSSQDGWYTNAGGYYTQTPHASGGSWMIPAAYGYEGYRMPGGQTASGGEVVTITPKNQVGQGGGITATQMEAMMSRMSNAIIAGIAKRIS